MIAELHCVACMSGAAADSRRHLCGAALSTALGWITNDTGRAQNPRPLNRGDDEVFLLGEHGDAGGVAGDLLMLFRTARVLARS
jgi:hypothetical protein